MGKKRKAISVKIYPSLLDEGFMTGMCGTLGQPAAKSLLHRDGSHTKYRSVDFVKHWR